VEAIVKKLTMILAVVFLGTFFVAGSSMALTVNPAPGSELDLQIILNNAFGENEISANNDQSSAESWIPSYDGPADSYAVTFYKGDDGELWIYSTVTGEEYKLSGDVELEKNTFSIGSYGSGGVTQYALTINDVLIDETFGESFGFVWHDTNPSYSNNRSYTQDYLNAGNGYGDENDILALTYNLDGKTWTYQSSQTSSGDPIYTSYLFEEDDWLIAFEDRYSTQGGDGDFNDAVFIIEDITPVPEPATMMLLGFGLIGVGVASRKKLFKK
jgi:hypothetical protein